MCHIFKSIKDKIHLIVSVQLEKALGKIQSPVALMNLSNSKKELSLSDKWAEEGLPFPTSTKAAPSAEAWECFLGDRAANRPSLSAPEWGT